MVLCELTQKVRWQARADVWPNECVDVSQRLTNARIRAILDSDACYGHGNII